MVQTSEFEGEGAGADAAEQLLQFAKAAGAFEQLVNDKNSPVVREEFGNFGDGAFVRMHFHIHQYSTNIYFYKCGTLQSKVTSVYWLDVLNLSNHFIYEYMDY